MNLLLDTHVFLWAVSEPERLPPRWRAELENPLNIVYISSISITEILIKLSIGKLHFPFDIQSIMEESGFTGLSYTLEDSLVLARLPLLHKDPFDRMLVAQSLRNDFYLVSADDVVRQYPCRFLLEN